MTMALPLPTDDLDLVLAHTASLWSEAKGQKIFVTGGTGFFGCWLVESFCHINRKLDLGAHMTVLSRDPAKFFAKCPHLEREESLNLHSGDVRNFASPPGTFNYIIHAATETTAKADPNVPLELLDSIIAGTERTLKFAMDCGAKKFLLTSSGAIYGRQPPDLAYVPETYVGAPDPLSPASDYGEGKRTSELMCALYQRAATAQGLPFEAKIARCWAFCGPHLPLDAHFAIGNFIGDVIAGRPIAIGGDGTPRRSYLYAADLAVWLWTILFRGPALVPINVGSGYDVSIRELAEAVATAIAPSTSISIARQPLLGVAPARYVPSVERAEALLGLRATVGLEDAIRRSFAWSTRR